MPIKIVTTKKIKTQRGSTKLRPYNRTKNI